MPFTIKMPKLSPTMEQGTVVKWLKNLGDRVQEGEVLMEVATDKATVEFRSFEEGILRKILVEEGKEVSVNQPVAIMTQSADESIEGYQVEQEKAPVEEKEKPQQEVVVEKKQQPTPSPAPSFQAAGFSPEQPLEEVAFQAVDHGERIKASPLAKKIAKQKGLDITTVKGSGPSGRVVVADLEQAQSMGSILSP